MKNRSENFDQKRTVFRIILILLFQGFLFRATWADQVGSSGMQFLLLSQGARESAMGGAFTALSDDAMGIYCNPAALVQMTESEISLSHLSWVGRTNEESAAYVQPLKGIGAVGGGLSLYWVPSFDNTGGLESAVAPLSYEGIVSYADLLPNPLISNLSLGGSLKYAGSSLAGSGQNGDLMADLGIFYASNWKPFRLGIVAENIGLASSVPSSPAFTLRAGASLRDGGGLVALEVIRVLDQNYSFQMGGEYWLRTGLAFRAGVKADDSVGSFLGFSMGVGLRVETDYQLDYAASTLGDLGLIQWVSLRVAFGAPEKVAMKPVPATPDKAPPASESPIAAAVIPRLAPPYRKSIEIFQKALVRSTSVPEDDPASGGRSSNTPIPGSYAAIKGFPVSLDVVKDSVEVNWSPQSFQKTPAGGYNVYVSIVPGADFKKLNDKPVEQTHWAAEVGLRGMTYYFLVKAVGTEGVEMKSSEVKGIQLP